MANDAPFLGIDGWPTEPTEWQCTCGTWVPIGYSRHSHVVSKRLSFEELHAARARHESGMILAGMSLLPDADTVEITHVLRTKEMPTR